MIVSSPQTCFSAVSSWGYLTNRKRTIVNNRHRIPSQLPTVRTDHGGSGRSEKAHPQGRNRWGDFYCSSTNDPPGGKQRTHAGRLKRWWWAGGGIWRAGKQSNLRYSLQMQLQVPPPLPSAQECTPEMNRLTTIVAWRIFLPKQRS